MYDAVQSRLLRCQRYICISFLTRLDISVDDYIVGAIFIDRDHAVNVADRPRAIRCVLVHLYMKPVCFNRRPPARYKPLCTLSARRFDVKGTLDCNDRAVLIITYAKGTTAPALHINL